jgi:hypothetical protein
LASSYVTGMKSQQPWPSGIVNEFRSLLHVKSYLSAHGATPPER